MFREFVVLCRQLDLFERELVAVDGTRIKAVNNKTRNFTRASLAKAIQDADERLAGYMKRLDEGDVDEHRTPGGGSGTGDGKLAEKIAAIQGKRDRHKEMLAERDRTDADQISLTDPDARTMARMTKVGVGYNIQLAVDVKHKLIADQAVSNPVLDLGLLAQTATVAMEALGVERIEDVADRGGSGNLHSGDKWIVGLTAAMLAASRRQNEQATPPEPQPGIQGQGGVGCRERREDASRVGAAI